MKGRVRIVRIAKRSVLVFLASVLALTVQSCSSKKNASAAETAPSKAEYTAPLLADPEDASKEAAGQFTVLARDNAAEVTVSGNDYMITSAGEYTFTGKLENGSITVNAGDEDKVKIILNGVTINSSDSAPVCVLGASKVDIVNGDGKYNVIKDERTTVADGYDGAVYSTCDLGIKGGGTLIVSSSAVCGIKTKGDLEIEEAALKVTSPDAALRGNDSVTVDSGDLMLISTGADGIKTSNSEISSKGNQRGTVTVGNAHMDIYSAGDGISSAYDTVIASGGKQAVIFINTGSYSGYTTSQASSASGIKAANAVTVSGGTLTVNSAGDGIHAKAGEELDNGQTSVGNVTLGGGLQYIVSSDDAVHADGTVTISGGELNVTDSHEAIEGNVIRMTGGSAYLYGSDDGMNAMKGAVDTLIEISGGYLEVTTPSGDTDAVDSNGDITVSGGFVLIKSGSETGMVAGSVDADGTFKVTGGTVVALGGVAKTPQSGSVGTRTFDGQKLSAGEYTVRDDGENTLISFSTDKEYSLGWIASDKFSSGNTYSLNKDSTEITHWKQS